MSICTSLNQNFILNAEKKLYHVIHKLPVDKTFKYSVSDFFFFFSNFKSRVCATHLFALARGRCCETKTMFPCALSSINFQTINLRIMNYLLNN